MSVHAGGSQFIEGRDLHFVPLVKAMQEIGLSGVKAYMGGNF